jgi:SnoaL-like domain
MASAKELLERLTIREIVENWALLRDARRWDRFRELWHEEGRMITTWIEGSFEEFINASQAGYDSAAPPSISNAIAPSLRRSRQSHIGSRSTTCGVM